jgi:hypothetical protein
MQVQDIVLEKLLLDPNNYRFAEVDGFVAVAESRFAEDSVQRRALDRLRRDEGIVELKKSIVKNGFLPIERIVIRRISADPEQFLVIEGNRRTAAAKWILEDHEAGIDIPDVILDSVRNIPCLLIEENEDSEVLRASLMGIRHVSGIRQWGGYQRAKLVANMKDDLQLDSSDISDRLGMSANEVNRRYRAIKALQQMQQDDEYGDYALPALYPIFHEAVSLPVVREWLGWDPDKNLFTNASSLENFYSLLAPTTDDSSGVEVEAKITNRESVRDLRVVLGNTEAREALFQPGTTFASALLIVQQGQLASSWVRQVEEAISALGSLGVDSVRNLTEPQRHSLERLKELAEQRLADHTALAS